MRDFFGLEYVELIPEKRMCDDDSEGDSRKHGDRSAACNAGDPDEEIENTDAQGKIQYADKPVAKELSTEKYFHKDVFLEILLGGTGFGHSSGPVLGSTHGTHGQTIHRRDAYWQYG